MYYYVIRYLTLYRIRVFILINLLVLAGLIYMLSRVGGTLLTSCVWSRAVSVGA